MVAVFDNFAFHQTMPQSHYVRNSARSYYEKYKIRRYGFHGTSHKYAFLSRLLRCSVVRSRSCA